MGGLSKILGSPLARYGVERGDLSDLRAFLFFETISASSLSLFTLPARISLLRLLAGPLDLKGGLSPEVANAYVAFTVVPRHIQTTLDEGRGMPDSLAQADAVTSFGAVPLIVLSRGHDQEQDWQEMQADLLNLSSNSQQLIADQSGHNIQLDQPEAAVKAIVTMVEQVRRQSVQ